MVTLKHLDFLLALLKEAPDHKQAGSIWNMLLSSYINREIIHGASKWLLSHGGKEVYSSSVAARLLDETSSHEIIEVSRRLLEQEVDFLLAKALLFRAPDHRTIDIAIEMINSQDPTFACLIAPALMKSGDRGANAVTEFLNEHCNSKRFNRVLTSFVYEAPELAAPLIREWVSKHPRSRDAERLLVDVLRQSPSQEYVNLLWTWCKTNSRKSDILDVLTIFSTKFPTPKDTVMYARNWLESNETHSLWTLVFFKAVDRSTLHEQIEIVKHWLHRLSEQEIDTAISIMLRASSTNGINEQSFWSELSKAFDNALISPEKKKRISEEYDKGESAHEPGSEYPLVRELATRDPKSVRAAKDWLTERRLEWRWTSLHEYRGEIIAALFAVSPDQFVLDEARSWLEKRPEHYFQALYERVNTLMIDTDDS